jgi:NTE family protein
LENKRTIGLVLSGGGARGLTHVGVLRALDELGVKPTHISGTSAGALVGGMYAAGIAPAEILRIAQDHKFLTHRSFNLRSNGFFSLQPLIQLLEKSLPIKKFEELPIKFYATATNIEDGFAKIFDSGDMIQIMVASSAVPVMFAPVMMEGKPWLDGGVINNFPVEPVEHCNVVIGSNVSTWPEAHKNWSRISIIQRCFHLTMTNYLSFKKAKCHIYIDPPVGHYGAFGKSKFKELADTGYAATMAQKEKIIALLNP